jgi:hypothetical protein
MQAKMIEITAVQECDANEAKLKNNVGNQKTTLQLSNYYHLPTMFYFCSKLSINIWMFLKN